MPDLRLCLFSAGFALALPGFAAGRDLTVGAGKAFPSPSAAAAAAQAGDRILVSPGQYFDCAVLAADHLTIEGVGDAAAVVLTDKTCEGKALLVITGQNVTVANLTLTRARVPDGNGAGIRAEADGELTVDGVRFINNQDGILTNPDPAMTLTVRGSLFDHNGVCGNACSHAIYAGHIARLTVDRSVFRDTREGHDIKSRALRTVVTGCDIEDGPEGTASFLVELPNGGALVMRDNTLEKGPHSGNHTSAVSIGMEGVDQPTAEITVEGNHFTNDGDYHTAFVNNVTATEAVLRRNVLRGAVDPLHGDGSSQ